MWLATKEKKQYILNSLLNEKDIDILFLVLAPPNPSCLFSLCGKPDSNVAVMNPSEEQPQLVVTHEAFMPSCRVALVEFYRAKGTKRYHLDFSLFL